MEQQNEKKDLSAIWKILVFLLIGILIGIFAAKYVSAAWPLDKWTTCDIFNKTRADCDNFWCNITDCVKVVYLNSTNMTCFNYTTLNCTTTNYTNYTYNKTEIVEFVLNITNSTISFETCRNYTDSQLILLRDSLVNKIENKTYSTYYSNNNNDDSTEIPPYVWVIAIIAFVGLIIFLVMNSNKKKHYTEPKPVIKSFNKPKPRITEEESKTESRKKFEEHLKRFNPNEFKNKDEPVYEEFEEEIVEDGDT